MKTVKKYLALLILILAGAGGMAFSSPQELQSPQGVTLLVNGSQAFPQIIESIENAQKSILVNMFIWRDDWIGNYIAQELVEAADRGVKITVSKDLYGSVCEHAEESTTSFFHKKLTFAEKIKVLTLKLLYKPAQTKNIKDSESNLYKTFMNHPNITVEKDTFKADHSKFYIFDDETLIMGGVNIEDKENGADMSGRFYEDYMIMLKGADYISDFLAARKNGITKEQKNSPYYFGVNVKQGKNKIFQMEDLYLDLINSSQKELTIVMAYFSPLKNFTKAILEASERGVDVKIIIPAKANFQDPSNKKTVYKLIKKSNGKIKVYLSPKMLHTKLMYNESTLSFGSSNITKKAFTQLDELNLFTNSNWADFNAIVAKNVAKTISESSPVTSLKQVKYNKFIAWLEGFLV